jgi:hypothetical protein
MKWRTLFLRFLYVTISTIAMEEFSATQWLYVYLILGSDPHTSTPNRIPLSIRMKNSSLNIDQKKIDFFKKNFPSILAPVLHETKELIRNFDSYNFIKISPTANVEIKQKNSNSSIFKVRYYQKDSPLDDESLNIIKSTCPSILDPIKNESEQYGEIKVKKIVQMHYHNELIDSQKIMACYKNSKTGNKAIAYFKYNEATKKIEKI